MPLSKQARALYEAALRRKGLQPGKAVRQDPRTFVGPIRTVPGAVRSPYYHPEYHTQPDVFQMPADTYWTGRGRLQDLEDELRAARDAGLIESKSHVRQSYRRYYNDGDVPNMPGRPEDMIENYGDPYGYKYMVPHYRKKYDDRMNPYYEFVADRPHLTRMGELELEARADAMIENDYKDYLKKMFQRFPNRAAVREEFPEEYNAMPYLEDLFPED